MTSTNEDDRHYISPYDFYGRQGYLVRPQWWEKSPSGKYRKRWHSKLFQFVDYSSPEETLNAARAYRDNWLAENADKTFRLRTSFLSSRLPKNNTTGILGVTHTESEGKGGYAEIKWQTTFPKATGKGVWHRSRSVKRHNEVEALRQIVQERRDGMLAVFKTRQIEEDDEPYEMVGFYDDIIDNLADLNDRSTERDIIDIVRDDTLSATSKFREIQVRIAQQRFRRQVLEYFDNRCAITGSTVLIRAGHIKPWRVANDTERIDPSNGLALSPVYDAAFDVAMISFDDGGRIIVCDSDRAQLLTLGITGREAIAGLSDEHYAYLNWHRENLFVPRNTGEQNDARERPSSSVLNGEPIAAAP